MWAIGDIKKRNKNSIEPTDYEHEQPIQISKEILALDTTKEIESIMIESLEADYLIVLTEEPGDNKLSLIED